jgi:transposase
MAKTGRPKASLELSFEERGVLERLVKRARTNRHLAFRARIVLLCASGASNTEVAREVRATGATVGKWRKRFVMRRLDGLHDEPRPGRARTIRDNQVEDIVVRTLESTPKGRSHWSTRSMARHVGLSHSSIGRIWRTFGLKPHLVKNFKLSDDPYFVEKIRDIVGLYMSPPDNAVVLSVDEKSQIQALARATPILPMDVGQPERRTHNYIRHGTVDLFAALDVATGQVIGRCFARHRAVEFLHFIKDIDRTVDPALNIHVVLDNLSTHKTPAVMRWLVRHPRFHLHFTPTHASWVNMVERFFGLLTDQALRRGSHTSVPNLKSAIHDFIETHNEAPTPFRWTKTADEILSKVARYATRTLQAHEPQLLRGITDPGY